MAGEAPTSNRRRLAGDKPATVDGPHFPRGLDDHILAPDEYAESISGFTVGYDGTLEPVFGPAPFVPDYGAGYPTYTQLNGLFHTTVNRGGPQSILLAHVGKELWEFNGWDRQWNVLVGSTGLLTESFSGDRRPDRFPTQFVGTPAGTVIIPQTSRPLFYDGEVLARFGYSRAPGSPALKWVTTNRAQLKHDNNGGGAKELPFFTEEHFGLGSAQRTSPAENDLSEATLAGSTTSYGYARQALYSMALRWIDRWGNLSPIGHRAQVALPKLKAGRWSNGIIEPDRVLRAAGFSNVERGDDKTIGRIWLQSKDLRSSGDPNMYEIPGEFPSAWATIPENVSTHFSIAHTDMELGALAADVLPVPQFRVGQMALSRFWAGNIDNDTGRIMGSIPGLWGTFNADLVRYPDPQGAAITGMWPSQDGMLAFTKSSTFLVMEGDNGDIRIQPLSRFIGCAAPSSLATLPDGRPIWWAGDNFAWMGERGPEIVSKQFSRRLSRVNSTRSSQAVGYVDYLHGEYRCWLPSGGSEENDLCFAFDGMNWRERPGERASCVTTINEPPYLSLIGGRVADNNGTHHGVWALDRQSPEFTPQARTYRYESIWFQRAPNATRQSALRLALWLREEVSSEIELNVYRDYREGVDTHEDATIETQASTDPPPMWSSTNLGAGSRWQRRRLFWTRKSISVSSCESFKIVLTSKTPFALMGLEFDGIDRKARGRLGGS